MIYGLEINDYQKSQKTTSQEGGAVSEARPPGRVSEAVFYSFQQQFHKFKWDCLWMGCIAYTSYNQFLHRFLPFAP
jgi:hypothetical protein